MTVEEQAELWIELTRAGRAASDDLFDRGFQLSLDARDDPEFAWEVIKHIVSRNSERDLFTDNENDAKRVLANLGAGPLEDLLAHNGERFIDRIESEAARDRRFFWTLACVWRNETAEDVWNRVQAVTKGFSP